MAISTPVISWRFRSDDHPLRMEPFGLERLEQHARSLGQSFVLRDKIVDDGSFLKRTVENAQLLRRVNQLIAAIARQGDVLESDAEWLLDNFYIVEEQLREIHDDLPESFFRELPQITTGQPRVHALALELIGHTDSVLDEETVVRFISQFQTVMPLNIGELWAFPIMLRLVLVENLRRIASQFITSHACQAEAVRILDAWKKDPSHIPDLSQLHECKGLILHLFEGLQDDRPGESERMRELERRLAAHHVTPADISHEENQRRAANQVSIGNVITSMRLISTLDWASFFERTSLVDEVLRTDPLGIYPRMELESRDRYRHVIERLAKGSQTSEVDVARQAIQLAEEVPLADRESKSRHVGYWLIDAGLPRLEQQLKYRPRFKHRVQRWLLRWPDWVFVGSVTMLTLALLALGALALAAENVSWPWIAALALLATIPLSEVALSLTNLLVTFLLPPRLLPKLDFSGGIPNDCRTVVIVPSMLSGPGEIESLLERLEMHYLSGPDPQLRFVLLTDFTDAPQQEMPQDAALLAQARAGIEALNLKYQRKQHRPFYLLHRRRTWNARENVWMGWERKRGKLVEFHQLMQGKTDTNYQVLIGDMPNLIGRNATQRVRFVITLDSDTQLPHGAARRMIGTLAHPLNRPTFDPALKRFTSGYVLLQPRIGVHLASANRTRFAKLFSNSPGVDPYVTCASDVYQDLYGEGSFTGKGIYDFETFSQALDDTFPENQILSHDLIEGCHVRVALVSDIELFDNYPPRYEADARRQHRWVRGDWQIFPWLLPWVPTPKGWRSNTLSLLSRWKIFDNLRRSLAPPLLTALMIVGWFAAPQAAPWFTLAGLLVLCFPLLAQLVLGLVAAPSRNITSAERGWTLLREVTRSLQQSFFAMAVLPQRGWMMLDAIARTLVRMTLTRRRMLEWETASDVERRVAQSRWAPLTQMWYVPLLAVVLPFVLAPAATLSALPFLLAWLSAPFLSYWTSFAPTTLRSQRLGPSQAKQLRLEARRIWSFFETYVDEAGNFLPPDNVQEYPHEKVAYRTSPTNEGLYLVAALVAREFGYLSLHGLAERWELNLNRWETLDRFQGHFYNWYETSTLKPLYPRYISTVDSGNLAACFLTAQQGIMDLLETPIDEQASELGLADTIAMIEADAIRIGVTSDATLERDWNSARRCFQLLLEHRGRGAAALAAEQELEQIVPELLHHFDLTEEKLGIKLKDLLGYLSHQRAERDTLLPWQSVVTQALPPGGDVLGEQPPTLTWFAGSQPEAWQKLWQILRKNHSLKELAQLPAATNVSLVQLQAEIQSLPQPLQHEAMLWQARLRAALHAGADAARALQSRLEALAARFENLALSMDFKFLFNVQRRLFSIGFNLEEGTLDRSHYDMLCSECRIASYFAVAKGDVEAKHWFRLGRQMTYTAGRMTLLSWGGTMFEYLMPCLFQRQYEDSLITQSCHGAIARQQEYGRQRGVPWGISECAFGALAVNSDYHYRSFGVPGLGLKRGLSKDLVISPYSAFLAVEFAPADVLENLSALQLEGALGDFGYYEAIDFTPERLPAGKRSILVRCYMAHHQGMSLLALGNTIIKECVRNRFHSHPLIRSSELLLQEKTPLSSVAFQPHPDEERETPAARAGDELVSRRIVGIEAGSPLTHILSNGEYSVCLTHTGTGYSKCGETAISRWRPDAARDEWGQFIYLRDVKSGRVWSPTYQPTCVVPDSYEVVYSIDKVDFHRVDGAIESHLEVVVSPENHAELRQLKLTNHGAEPIEIELTTYLEIALASQAADAAHPAFQKLFIETEFVPEESALIAKRRPREASHQPPWAVHVLAAGPHSAVEYETSRAAFLGRNGNLKLPAALQNGSFPGTTGAVLDPVLSLRTRVIVPPSQSVMLAVTTAFAKTREEAIALADQYHEPRGVQRAFELAWAYAQVELRHLHVSPAKMHLYQRLASKLIFPESALRAPPQILAANRQGQRALWRFGISGDHPILLVHVTDPDQVDLVRDLLRAHSYLRGRGLRCDLVLLNDYPGSYFDALQEQLVTLMEERQSVVEGRPTDVFLLRGGQLHNDDRTLLDTVACVVLSGIKGSLSEQLEAVAAAEALAEEVADLAPLPRLVTTSNSNAAPGTSFRPTVLEPTSPTLKSEHIVAPEQLEFWNGYGGFAHDGREYHIRLTAGQSTPMPWSNVIANERFGCLQTETGGGYTWFENSRECKLTSWANDPILDTPSEWLLLKDLSTGEVFSPLAGSKRDAAEYWTQHGQGYSRHLHTSHELAQEVLISIAPSEPIKFIVVRLKNLSTRPRELSATFIAEWVLGVDRPGTRLHVVTSIDETTGALLACNPYHPELAGTVAFLHTLNAERSFSGDRREIFGSDDGREFPALAQARLSQKVGAGLDPCGALQTKLKLAPGAEQQFIFLLGAGRDQAEVNELLAKFHSPSAVDIACQQARDHWDETLSAIQIKTPSREMDLLVNRWLLYQTLSCRVWGRSAYYQAGGAYGFRDQLQDVMALVYSRPELAREHLLRAAARQFEEGDVQHWWHPPQGRGTRTRFSDDLLWLPFVVCRYLAVTGDASVLDETASYLQSPLLGESEQERYELPTVSAREGSLYEHCLGTLQHGFRLGPHGLPLIGCGDWNDGMNQIGPEGKGESVWMGWFLLVILDRFIPIIRQRGDTALADEMAQNALKLRHSMEVHGWDGAWYRRAYFDDGTPLGSAQNDECQIDSIAQTWAVLAGAPEQHQLSAVEAVMRKLVKWDSRLVLLFTPPFDHSHLEPGYIKGYLPGIRENGGQYTHPALWLIEALCQLGDGTRAMQIFDLINPVNHSRTATDVRRYMVEPYVIAADVYGVEPHIGRGGWTWYTGSAAWTYRAALESILGLRWSKAGITFQPQLPASWNGFEMTVRRDGQTQTYQVSKTENSGTGYVVNVVQQESSPPPIEDNSDHGDDSGDSDAASRPHYTPVAP